MPPRRRTFCFVLILLSLQDEHVFVASFGMEPATNTQPVLEYYSESRIPQQVNSLIKITSGNGGLTEFLPDGPRMMPGIQQLIPNEALLHGCCPQGSVVNNGLPSNYVLPNQNSLTAYSSSPTYFTPLEASNSALQLVQPNADILTEIVLTNPTQVEMLTVVDQNYPPVTQTVEAFAPSAKVAEVYPTPINVEIPSMPQLSPFIAVATPFPEKLPSQTIAQEVYTANILPEVYPQTIDTGIATVTSVPVETTVLSVPSSNLVCNGQQLPFSLQINMPSPHVSEPVITVISPQQSSVPSPNSQYEFPSIGISPYPVIVMEKSRSKWKRILPILLLTLFDGFGGYSGNGGGSSGGCCSQCTPIPFPIVIPTNNPIICGSSRSPRKSKAEGPLVSINNECVV